MNFSSNDNPVLVAPRPVRLTSPFASRAHSIRFVSAPEANAQDDFKLAGLFPDSASDKDTGSPRSSPRATLPSEALEEFLSILRPSIFPPRSPVHHARKSASLPTFQHDRSYSFKGRLLNVEESSETPRALAQSPDLSENNESVVEFELVDADEGQRIRWFTSSVLSSPISRNNTRNPFQRHASYQISLTPSPTVRFSPSPSTLSPAAIPLPLPTADEMVDML